jgi:dipeptidyl-peptidase-3
MNALTLGTTPKRRRRVLAAAIVALASVACSNPNSDAIPGAQPERQYLLERVGDAAVVQLYADGFESLSLREQTLIWHLYQAAIAGRDIYYDQRYEHGLEMREVIEGTLRHGGAIDPATRRDIEQYAKLFWINSGPYNNLTARKFVLTTTPQAFRTAVTSAAAAGATFPRHEGESLDQMLARLEPMFFDASFEPSVTAKAPPAGEDILTASFNNLYDDVSVADLAKFSERYPLNSRLVKRDGRLIEQVYRVGGRYDAHIRLIVGHLEAAIPFATPEMADALRALIKWYRTGEVGDRRAYDIAWVKDTASPVDTINGFTEVYLDARGVKGAWEALVFYVNPQKTSDIQKLAAEAQWFEDRMPWDPKYRKAGVKGITANAIDVVIETGDSGPVTPIGINLPNDQDVRERYGSKSVSLANVNEAYDKSADPAFRREFAWSDEEAARSQTWGGLAGELTTNMHEVIGHASGQLSPHLDGRPELALKEYYSALEEGRADLVGLYFIADPKLAELGLLNAADQPEVVRAEYEGYTRNAIVQLRRLRGADTIEEDHMRNRQMIVHWLMANTNAIEKRTRDGKSYYVMVDAAAFRDGVGRLLGEVQRIKSEGDYAAAKALFDQHGVHVDVALRDEVLRRVDALNLTSYSGFVMPELEAVAGANGAITQVKISYPKDLAAQMLRFSEQTRDARAALLAAERTGTSPGGR